MAALAATTVMLGQRRKMATSRTTRADAAPVVAVVLVLAARVASDPAVRVDPEAGAVTGRVRVRDVVKAVRVDPVVVVTALVLALGEGREISAGRVDNLALAIAMIARVAIHVLARNHRRAMVAGRVMIDVVPVVLVDLIREVVVLVDRVPDGVVLAGQEVARVDGGWTRPKALHAPGRSPILLADRNPASPSRLLPGVGRVAALLRTA
jgi:hypothetical protein